MAEKEEKQEEKPSKSEDSKSDDKDKAIKELEKKLGEQGKELGDHRVYVAEAEKVWNAITENSKLKSRVQEAYAKSQGIALKDESPEEDEKGSEDAGSKKATKEVEKLTSKVADVEESRRNEIIEGFWADHEMDKMEKDERDAISKEIEVFFRQFDRSVKTIPVKNLRRNLDSAYTAISAAKVREEGKKEGAAQAKRNEEATFPSMKSGKVRETPGPKLTGEQADWVKKLGGDPERAAKYKAAGEAYTRLPPKKQ